MTGRRKRGGTVVAGPGDGRAAVAVGAVRGGGTGRIEAEALVRRFGSVTAVAGVDLLVETGEIFGFLGPNGAGKTTCVRMLVTLLRPTSGQARVAGFDVVTQTYDVRRAIGVALQEAAIDPFMTGRELLDLQGALHGLDKARTRRRGDELLARVGLSAVADRAVSTFSGGMQRRLDLAMALLNDPLVLFLDEPTAGLDPISRASLWDEVRSLNSEHGTTVFLTTHYLEEAEHLAGRVAIVDHGVIVKEGRPDRLRAEMGAPVLTVAVAEGRHQEARDVLARFGPAMASAAPTVAIRLPGGPAQVATVIRALDAAGLVAQSLELSAPSMDEVFAAATGSQVAPGEEGGDAPRPADEAPAR